MKGKLDVKIVVIFVIGVIFALTLMALMSDSIPKIAGDMVQRIADSS